MYILLDGGDVTAFATLTTEQRDEAMKHGWEVVYVPVALSKDTWPLRMYGARLNTAGYADWDLADPGTEDDEERMPEWYEHKAER